MRLIIEETYSGVSCWAASYIAKKINDFNPTPEKPFVLGLPTGSTPLGTYKELIKHPKKEDTEEKYRDKKCRHRERQAYGSLIPSAFRSKHLSDTIQSIKEDRKIGQHYGAKMQNSVQHS